MKNLIEKYFRGETSLQEEADLKANFNEGQVDAELQEYAPLFQYFQQSQTLELGDGFEDRLFAKLEVQPNLAISSILEKYFNGETSLHEEATLKTYFNSVEVDPELKAYQPLFQYFSDEKEMSVSDDFDKKLLSKMGGEARIIPLRHKYRTLLRVAAVGVVLIGAMLFLNRPAPTEPPTVNWEQYEIQDEQLAYDETVKALKLLSSKLNKAQKMTHDEIAKTSPASKYLN